MKGLKEKFQKDLRLKLEARITSSMSEEKAILFAFRYYDLSNSGKADIKQFRQVVAKFGLYQYSPEESLALFQIFDEERKGSIDHKIFISRILGVEKSQIGHSVQSTPEVSVKSKHPSPEQTDKILDLLGYKAKKRGLTGLLTFSSEFHRVDTHGDFLLSLDQFSNALLSLNVELAEHDVEAVFNYFENKNGNTGFMNYLDLIVDLQAGGLPIFRRDLVIDIFHKFDFKRVNHIDIRMLKDLFNAKNYFDVKGGRRTIDEIEVEFKKAISLYAATLGGKDKVNLEEFIDFWAHLSPTIANDMDFEHLIRKCFRYNELPSQVEETAKFNLVSNQYNDYSGQASRKRVEEGGRLDRIKSNLREGGPSKFIHLYKSFKHNDHDNDGKLSCREFIQSLKDVRIALQDNIMSEIFNSFDVEK